MAIPIHTAAMALASHRAALMELTQSFEGGDIGMPLCHPIPIYCFDGLEQHTGQRVR